MKIQSRTPYHWSEQIAIGCRLRSAYPPKVGTWSIVVGGRKCRCNNPHDPLCWCLDRSQVLSHVLQLGLPQHR